MSSADTRLECQCGAKQVNPDTGDHLRDEPCFDGCDGATVWTERDIAAKGIPWPDSLRMRWVMEHRPSWHDYFMEIANVASRRASCPRLQVGAVLIRNNHIVTTGYNGSPHGFPHCTDEGCDIFKAEYSPDDVREHCQRTVHAEMNVIIEAAKIGVSTEGTCMYITAFPCWVCARHIIQANITTIIYKPHPKYGPDSKTLTAFKSAGIEVLDYTTLVNQ